MNEHVLTSSAAKYATFACILDFMGALKPTKLVNKILATKKADINADTTYLEKQINNKY